MFFLLTTIVFLITRQTVNEQYIMYFISLNLIFISLNEDIKLKNIFLIIQINAIIFILINNVFLIRLFTPINENFYIYDINLTTSEPFRFIRFTTMLVSGSLNTIFLIYYLKKITKLI